MRVTVAQYLKACRYRIQGGSPFLWNCYGPDAQYIDCGNYSGYGREPHWMASAIIDRETQFVYEVRCHDEGKKYRAWRWINPKFVQASKDEHKARGFRFKDAAAPRDFVDMKTPVGILEKIEKLVAKYEKA